MLRSTQWRSWTAKLTLWPPWGPSVWALCWTQCLNSVRSWVPWASSLMRWPSSWPWCWFLQVRILTKSSEKSHFLNVPWHSLWHPLCPSDRSGISDIHAVEQLQEGLTRALRSLITRHRPDDTSLFSKLLLRLPDLRTLNNMHSDKLLAFRIDPWTLCSQTTQTIATERKQKSTQHRYTICTHIQRYLPRD